MIFSSLAKLTHGCWFLTKRRKKNIFIIYLILLNIYRVHVYPEGKHNIHIRYADDFNRRVQEFLLEAADV